MTEPKTEQEKLVAYRARQRKRSIAIGIALAVLVAIFYGLTVVKLGPAVFNRAL